MTDGAGLPPVAVFESELPPALNFIRSLGRAGVPIRAYARREHAAGRYSRFSSEFGVAPAVVNVDRFLAWLTDEVDRNGPVLVAPTSDFVTYALAEFREQSGIDLSGGAGGPFGTEAIWTCLFKDRFASRMEEIGFPVPAWAAPTSADEAVAAAEEIGYPVVLKPKSHAGIGIHRGAVAGDEAALRAAFAPAEMKEGRSTALQRDPTLALPILQEYLASDDLRVISVSGHVDVDGVAHGVECTGKLSQWGDELSIGTLFETVEPPACLDHVLDTVGRVLRSSIFEFELLIDQASGRYWALEINPRGFGQMSLSARRGHDLARLWYEGATGCELPERPLRGRRATHWRMGTPYFAGAAVGLVQGPGRVGRAIDLTRQSVRPTANAIHSWSDPLPGLVFAAWVLRHPKGLFRPYLRRR